MAIRLSTGKAIALCGVMLQVSLMAACNQIPANGTSKSTTPYVTQGEKFGVKIGMSRSQAMVILDRRGGTSYVESQACSNMDFKEKCMPGSTVDLYLHNEWIKNGTIILVVYHDRVVAISWQLFLGPGFQ